MADFEEPQSRNEAILQNILGADNELPEPQSRVEELLQDILEQGGTGGGTPGKSLEFDWDGTSLGVKQEGDANFEYVDLKGAKGDTGDGTTNFIRTAGKKFYDGDKEFVIKGMGFDNWAWFNPNVPMEWYCDESSYAELADMGINTIRWYLNYALLEDDNNPYVYKQTGWDWLDQNLEWADKYGIKIVINMHVPPSMPTEDWEDSKVESIQLWYGANASENRARLKALWQAIATRYKDNPTVLGYGLLNEPRVPYINNSEDDSRAQWETLANELKTLIRAIDTNHILFVEPTTKIYDTTNQYDIYANYIDGLFTINDDNYAVEFHNYDPMELTHQGYGDYAIGGMIYPRNDVIAVISQQWIDETSYTGDNSGPYDFTERGYQTIESDKYLVTEASTINLGYPMLICSNAGSGNTIYWDNVKIAQYTADGTFVKYICEYDFNDVNDFTIYSDYWDNKVNWSATGGVDDSGCLVVTGTDGELKVSQNSQYKFFKIEAGYKYSAVATVSIIGSTTTTILPHIVFVHTNSVHGIDKEYLREILTDYLNYSDTNNVPLYLGEYGAFVASYPYGGRQWISDMLELANEYNLSASFHEYKPGLYNSYYYKVVDNENVTTEEGTDVLDTQLFKIFKDRYKGIELTQNVIDKLTNTEKAEYINSWSVKRMRSMGIGNACWDYYDPSNAYLSNYINANGYAELAEKGFNSVRFYVNYRTFEDSYDTETQTSTFKASGWTWLDQHVAWCANNNLRMVISLHVPPGGFMKAYATGPFWDEDKMLRTKNIWVAIAERYANSETVVGFDLLNEPFLAAITGSVDGALELDGYYDFLNNIIADIRSVNTSAFFVIQRPYGYIKSGVQKYYGYTNSYRKVNDDKALYDLHFYYWNEYTHQEYEYGNLPTRVHYPDSAMGVLVYGNPHSFTKYNAVSFDYSNSNWQTVESELMPWDGTYNIGTWAFTFQNMGANGAVYIDDIVIKEYDSNGKYIRDMLHCDFEFSEELTSWNANNATGTSKAVSTDDNYTANGTKSLKITVATGEINVASTGKYQYIIPVTGNQYKLSCKMKFVDCENTITVKFGLRPSDGESYPFTKDYLRGILNKFMKWMKNNGVEMYIGEFSTTVPVMESSTLGGKEWLQDTLDLFDEYGLHYSFHDYHSPTFGYYKDAMNVSASTKVTNTDDVFENYVE